MLTVVSGPPCSGKSTYIRQHARPGALIIDLDRIAKALTTDDVPGWDYPPDVRDVALAARRQAIRRATTRWPASQLWIIDTLPDRQDVAAYRSAGARLITLDPGREVCEARARAERPAHVFALIGAWYAATALGAPAPGTDWTAGAARVF